MRMYFNIIHRMHNYILFFVNYFINISGLIELMLLKFIKWTRNITCGMQGYKNKKIKIILKVKV